LLEQRDPGFRGEARELFRRLLEPAAAALRGKTRIQFVPDGPLTELPFQALVDRTGKYWIETVTLAWAPSLTFLHDQARRHPAQRSAGEAIDLLALGDPAAPGVPPIPILREQVARIAALYPRSAVVRTGAAADEAAFRQFAPNARVLHLATHGIADAENAMRSRLLLARSEGEGAATSGDGWLEAWELMRLDLNADVAVLSACETGRGYTAEGEGLVGLTWALFVAGVHHTVVSQWRVESQSTTALMTKLHRGLQRGESPAAALRLSTLALMKDARYRHPFYWGAFVAAGNF
jgi:CHAT domain-containing protein